MCTSEHLAVVKDVNIVDVAHEMAGPDEQHQRDD